MLLFRPPPKGSIVPFETNVPVENYVGQLTPSQPVMLKTPQTRAVRHLQWSSTPPWSTAPPSKGCPWNGLETRQFVRIFNWDYQAPEQAYWEVGMMGSWLIHFSSASFSYSNSLLKSLWFRHSSKASPMHHTHKISPAMDPSMNREFGLVPPQSSDVHPLWKYVKSLQLFVWIHLEMVSVSTSHVG